MPSIIVVPDDQAAAVPGSFTLKERVSPPLMDDPHFAAQLMERVAWAIEDAERASADDGAS